MIPKKIGRYQIKASLTQSDSPTLLRAYDPNLEREVALKVLPPNLWHNTNYSQQFSKEMLTIASLEHHAIVPIYDFGVYEGQPFVVMRLMKGGSLAERLKDAPLSLTLAAHLVSSLAPLVDELHRRKLISDSSYLKPTNILFDEYGAAHLVSLGIRLASQGVSISNPEYMSPEELNGQALNLRSDVYRLGIILFEMLTAHSPFAAPTPAAVMKKHLIDPVPNILSTNPALPADCQSIIGQALAKEPDERYATARELSDAFQRLVVPTTGYDIRASGTPSSVLNIPQEASLIPIPKEAPAIPQEPPAIPQEASAIPIPKEAPAIPQELPAISQELLPIVKAPQVKMEAKARHGWQLNRWAFGLVMVAVLALLGWFTMDYLSYHVGTTFVSEKDSMTLVYVPEGEFLMGALPTDTEAEANEKPQRLVFLDAYWIDQTEVTNAMFARFVKETGHQTDAERDNWGFVYLDGAWTQMDGATWQHPTGPDSSLVGLKNYPVVQVSWHDANAYCKWAERRLPTEAEWEKAAGGNPTGEEGRKYAWGNELPPNAWQLDGIRQVASYGNGISPYQAFDMTSNVWEWTADWYNEQYHQNTENHNPIGTGGEEHTYRGGKFDQESTLIRGTIRQRANPIFRVNLLGFRCVQ